MSQTKLASLNEVLVGSVLNIAVALIFNVTLLPILIAAPVSFLMGLKVTAMYQVASVIIRFAVRRWNNAKIRRQMFNVRRSSGSIQSLPGRVSMPDMRTTDRNAHAKRFGGHQKGRQDREHEPTDQELRKRSTDGWIKHQVGGDNE